MRALFLLPWGFFLLGLLPLAVADPVGTAGWGGLLAALLLAAVASLYSRFPVAFPVQLALVLGLSLLAFERALEGALRLVGSDPPGYAALGGVLGALALGVAFFLGTGREAPLLPPLPGVGEREDLLRLAGALEGLALRRPLVLVYLATEAPPERLEAELRRGDLAFRLRGGVPPRPPGGPPRGCPGPPQAAPGPVSPLGLRGGALAGGKPGEGARPPRGRGPPPVLKRCSLLVPTPTRGVRVYPLEPPASLGLPLPWGLRRWTMEQGKAISEAWKEALETYGEREEE